MGVEYSLSETGPLGGNVTGPEESTLLVCFSWGITVMEIQNMVMNSGAACLKKKKNYKTNQPTKTCEELEELVLFKILLAVFCIVLA